MGHAPLNAPVLIWFNVSALHNPSVPGSSEPVSQLITVRRRELINQQEAQMFLS